MVHRSKGLLDFSAGGVERGVGVFGVLPHVDELEEGGVYSREAKPVLQLHDLTTPAAFTSPDLHLGIRATDQHP